MTDKQAAMFDRTTLPYVLLGFLLALGGVAAYVTLTYFHTFAFAFLFLAVCIIGVALRLKRGRVIIYNFAFVFVALGLFELYLAAYPATGEKHYEGTYSIGQDGKFFAHDPELGYAIAPGNRVVTSRLKAEDGSTIYNVTYSINQYGLRQGSAPQSAKDNDKVVLFFGDSFMFGEGVNDEETLPQMFSRLSGMRVINFGVPGWGPHQMLRLLELGRPKQIGANDAAAVVYLLLPDQHMFRAAGHAVWDKHGPDYETVDGAIKYTGPFPPSTRVFDDSRIASALALAKMREFTTDTDRNRVLNILLRARDLSDADYHAPFFVIVWGFTGDESNENWITDKLEQNGIPTLQLSRALPELDSDEYAIRGDGHPTAKAYALVANRLKMLIEAKLSKQDKH